MPAKQGGTIRYPYNESLVIYYAFLFIPGEGIEIGTRHFKIDYIYIYIA